MVNDRRDFVTSVIAERCAKSALAAEIERGREVVFADRHMRYQVHADSEFGERSDRRGAQWGITQLREDVTVNQRTVRIAIVAREPASDLRGEPKLEPVVLQQTRFKPRNPDGLHAVDIDASAIAI